MAQQTAVDWLINELANTGLLVTKDVDNLVAYHKAKAMEKEQIEKAFSDWQELPINNPLLPHYSSDEYYNETYNK